MDNQDSYIVSPIESESMSSHSNDTLNTRHGHSEAFDAEMRRCRKLGFSPKNNENYSSFPLLTTIQVWLKTAEKILLTNY